MDGKCQPEPLALRRGTGNCRVVLNLDNEGHGGGGHDWHAGLRCKKFFSQSQEGVNRALHSMRRTCIHHEIQF
jgi:hypothetical protein